MVQNAYIHIPFCRQKCNYCSFVSFPDIVQKGVYLINLEKEVRAKYKNELLKTLYFGGGTPSLLNIDEFIRMLSLFNINSETEVTVEVNPETVDFEYLQNLKNAGINRLSMGCQTFDDEILRQIGRRHNSNQVCEVVVQARKAGFDNISLDLIYGLPNQTVEGFYDDLRKTVELDVRHVSLYGLKIDEGCYFYKHYPKNLPDDEKQAEMYLNAINFLSENGFEHYEISNFAKPGYESKHNLNYWDNNSYYGFGIAAHGYVDGSRYSNPTTLEEYFKNPVGYAEIEKLSEQKKLEEEIFLGFRRMSGVDISLINKKFGIDFSAKYKKILDKYMLSKHITETDKGYKLTIEGVLVSNYILADFLDE